MSLLLVLGLAVQISAQSVGARAEKAVADARPTSAEITAAVSQPAKDLGLVKDVLPAPVRKAAEAPYAVANAADCAAIQAEIRSLDQALGPDVDAPPERSDTKGLAGDLIKGALQLPFSGVVRQLSGAARRDAAYRRAVAAGMVRRGFLRGRAGALGCTPDTKGGPAD